MSVAQSLKSTVLLPLLVYFTTGGPAKLMMCGA